jgi:hypothetical protein
MDNPQYYQPLSHALHPPRSSSQPQFYKTNSVEQQKPAESDDDGDEGIIEDELNRASDPASPKPQPAAPEHQAPSTQEPEPRRRGRPRGSKNRRNRVASTPAVKSPPSHQPLNTTAQGTAPPQLPEVTAQNQQYYEFQWRVLNLCAEFYGAAEELLKATPALVIAQCYQMGPSNKLDPLNMINEAKQNCDTLLANPSRLITAPPPPMYPVVPTFYATSAPPPPGPAPASGAAGPSNVISQPQSFVVSMNNSSYPAVYASPPSQYPTASYYQYPYGHPGAYYAPASVPAAAAPPAPATSTAPATATIANSSGVANSGAWSDEETERLKKMAEEKNSSGEIDWDALINQWGSGRSRHQILIKATQLGLKESSSVRGVKRRRETDSNGDPITTASAAPTPTPVAHNSPTPSSTPMASPSLQNQQQPHHSGSKPPSAVPAPPGSQPWPMPVVAVNTSPAVIGGSSTVTSYYRPRPTSSPKPSSATPLHRYMYQTNGHHSDSTK